MKTVCTAVLILSLAACGGAATIDENEDALSAGSKTSVTARRDVRRCASPACGGWFLRDANRKTAEQYVWTLDFAAAGFDDATAGKILTAPPEDLLLQGKLGSADAKTKQRTFQVHDAWRGLPGVGAAAGDALFAAWTEPHIACVAAPCLNQTARKVNASATVAFSQYDVGAAVKDLVDADWLTSRVRAHGALVAARVVEGAKLAAGPEKVLAISQVFVKLPERAGPCRAAPTKACAAGEEVVYQRDENRCVNAVGCVKPGLCVALAPSCAEGYSLVQWRSAPLACHASACDPAFSR
jgi:hypothetical protein